MEEQKILNAEIGDKEKQAIKPARVKVVGIRIEDIEKAKAKKIICVIKHPDMEDNFDISAVQYLKGKEVKQSGLWLKFDEDNKIQKGSATANFITYLGSNTIQGIVGKDVDTVADDKGYLVFKAY